MCPAKPIHSISCGKTLGSPSFQGKDSKYCPRESVSLPRLSVFSWQHASQGHRRADYRDVPFRKSPRNELGRQPNTKMGALSMRTGSRKGLCGDDPWFKLRSLAPAAAARIDFKEL